MSFTGESTQSFMMHSQNLALSNSVKTLNLCHCFAVCVLYEDKVLQKVCKFRFSFIINTIHRGHSVDGFISKLM